MQESFLHYLWQMQYFNKKELQTTEGEKIEVFSPGLLNTDAGPDFSNARIKIGSIGWVGSVEVHTRSSEWLNHHHDQDKAYDNVILHLVWQQDKVITSADNAILPTLELKGRVQESVIKTYRQLINSSFSIPCQRSLMNVSEITKLSMLEKTVMNRLERRAEEVRALHQHNGSDWEETFYQLLARNFGFKINAEPFFQLSKWLPLKTLLRHSDKQEQIEALLFGQAGFLDGAKGDEYYMKLRREHSLLAQKYSLWESRMSKAQWRFLRLRPANFPSLRLAQLGSVLYHKRNLFSHILECRETKSLVELFTATLSSYWLDHYQFSKKSKRPVHELGQASIENIIINTVVPVWVAYGRQMDEQELIDRALHVLQQLPGEQNKITRAWKNVGINSRTSFDSQSLIELYNNFCQRKNCLNCTIGTALIRPS